MRKNTMQSTTLLAKALKKLNEIDSISLAGTEKKELSTLITKYTNDETKLSSLMEEIHEIYFESTSPTFKNALGPIVNLFLSPEPLRSHKLLALYKHIDLVEAKTLELEAIFKNHPEANNTTTDTKQTKISQSTQEAYVKSTAPITGPIINEIKSTLYNHFILPSFTLENEEKAPADFIKSTILGHDIKLTDILIVIKAQADLIEKNTSFLSSLFGSPRQLKKLLLQLDAEYLSSSTTKTAFISNLYSAAEATENRLANAEATMTKLGLTTNTVTIVTIPTIQNTTHTTTTTNNNNNDFDDNASLASHQTAATMISTTSTQTVSGNAEEREFKKVVSPVCFEVVKLLLIQRTQFITKGEEAKAKIYETFIYHVLEQQFGTHRFSTLSGLKAAATTITAEKLNKILNKDESSPIQKTLDIASDKNKINKSQSSKAEAAQLFSDLYNPNRPGRSSPADAFLPNNADHAKFFFTKAAEEKTKATTNTTAFQN